MRFHDFNDERLAEYKNRIKRIKQAHPNTNYPSELARDFLCAEMACQCYGKAINSAATLGDTKVCEEIYSYNPKVINAKEGQYKDTPLINAVKRKRLGTAEWLLDHGAKILPNKKGYNPILWACFRGCVPALNMFKHYGVDFNKPFVVWECSPRTYMIPQRTTVYPIWCTVGHPKAFQWMIDNDVSIDVKFCGKTLRECFEKHPELLRDSTRSILAQKIINSPSFSRPQKSSLWQRFSFNRTKD